MIAQRELNVSASATEWLRQTPDRTAQWLDRRRLLSLAAFTAVFFATTVAIASLRPFWYDELFTFYMSKLPTVAAIRSALDNVVDQLPLPYYLVTRASQAVIGSGELGTRFPSIVGYWFGCVCLFLFVSRRTSAVHGWIAVAVTLASSFSYRYAYEARPYALVFGAGAAALLCWAAAAGSRKRPLALAGFALSLLAGTSSHYYAVLLLCPIALGEFVRTITSRRIDLAVWVAMIPSLGPLAFANAGKNLETYTNFWSAPRLSFFVTFHERMLGSLLLPAVWLLVIAAAAVLLRKRDPEPTEVKFAPPLYENAAVFGFVLLPVFGYVLAVVATNALVPRYVLPAVLGFAILIAYAAYFGTRGRAAAGLLALSIIAGGAGLSLARDVRSLAKNRLSDGALELPRAATDQPGPIVIENPLLFFEAAHRSRERQRLYYLVDPPTASKYSFTHLDPGLPLVSQIAPVRVEKFQDFTREFPTFIVCRSSAEGEGGWLVDRLLDGGFHVELIAKQGSSQVYRATAR